MNEPIKLNYVEGDATQPLGEGPRLILHIVNDQGGWGRGFVVALSKRWKAPERKYRAWFSGALEGAAPPALGMVQFVRVEDNLWVVNMVAQHGYSRPGSPAIRYDALEEALEKVAERANRLGATIHMPRIGCGYAGGRWEEIEPIIERTLVKRGLRVTVYDLPTQTRSLRRGGA